MRRLLVAIAIVATLVVASPPEAVRAADPAAEADFVARINALRAAHGVGPLGVHSVLVAKAQGWAQHMANTGCLCHSTLTDGITVGWRRLGENVGRGGDVGSIHQALVNSPGHRANMLDGRYRWVGVGVAYGRGSMWVAQVFMDGDPPPPPPVDLTLLDYRGRAIAARPQGGFWVLHGSGTVTAHEGAPHLGAPSFAGDIARDIVAMPDGNGYAILDGFGAVHLYGSAKTQLGHLAGPYWRGWDIARSLAIAPGGTGFAVLDGFGGVHARGTAPLPSGLPYWHGWDIARAIAYTPSGGLYILDGFGAVHARGGASSLGGPGFGWDIASDIVVTSGSGYAVLDGFGGVHPYGTARGATNGLYQHKDRWRGIVWQLETYLALRNDGTSVRV